jgi:hypothetical protein
MMGGVVVIMVLMMVVSMFIGLDCLSICFGVRPMVVGDGLSVVGFHIFPKVGLCDAQETLFDFLL